MNQHPKSDDESTPAGPSARARARRAMHLAPGPAGDAEQLPLSLAGRIRQRVGAWVTRHIVGVEPYPGLSRLDRWDGVGDRPEPESGSRPDANPDVAS